MYFAHRHGVEFKLSYLKNLKLCSIKVKQLFGPKVMPKKCGGFVFFEKKQHFLIRNQSFSNAWWFLPKNANLRRGISIKIKIDLVETKFGVSKIIIVVWVTCVQKNSVIRTFINYNP